MKIIVVITPEKNVMKKNLKIFKTHFTGENILYFNKHKNYLYNFYLNLKRGNINSVIIFTYKFKRIK